MNKKIIFFLILIELTLFRVEAKQLTNNVIVSIDNSIITELDVNKEINFLKFINGSPRTSSLMRQISSSGTFDILPCCFSAASQSEE